MPAGFIWVSASIPKNARRRDVWEFDMGVVGPSALGESAQDLFHNLIGSPPAGGWDHQLNNGLGLEIITESKWRLWDLATENGFGFDFIPHLGGRFGNVAIYANTGAELRFGWHVPKDFGSCAIRPGCDMSNPTTSRGVNGLFKEIPFGVHVFMGVDGRAVLRDIFLDGNTFQDSHSVDKEILVADLMAGLALSYHRFRLSYAYVYRTREFEGQKDPQIFGTFTFSFAY
jgi:lipid A 3-O-deacylase